MISFIRRSFKRQMFLVFLIITISLVTGAGIATVQAFQARVRADYERRDAEQEKVLEEKLVNMIDLTEETLDGIEDNDILMASFYKGVKSAPEIYAALYEETQNIRDFAEVDLYIGDTCSYSTRSGTRSGNLPEYYSVLYEAARAEGKTVYSLDPASTSEAGAALLITRKVVDKKESGYVVIRIDQDIIRNELGSAINARDGFILTNSFLRPLCSIGSATDGRALNILRYNFFNGNLYTDGFTSNVYINEIDGTGLLGIYITPPALDEATMNAGYQVTMIFVVISIIVCLIVAVRISSYVSKPLNVLDRGMKRFRDGDFDAKIEIDREDEFGELAIGFNKMTEQLKENMEEQVQAERTLNETRIEMMQAQLNPHFLYNTLDTIKWVAKANNVQEVATMSASLAGILRTSISERQFCKLSKELELVENYCEIQKIRFDDKFDLTIDVPEDVKEAVIPKLILQPMVENAIIHGMDETENGHIYIAAVRDNKNGEDLLKISIQDDGKGISDEMMNALNNDDVETLKGHLGLNNVNTIIRLYYGKQYGVMAFRPSEGGTVMIVTLPYSEKEPGE